MPSEHGSVRLSVAGLRVVYGDTVAVDDVDLSVATGEVVALLGPSGCGKSSLLRAVAGLEVAAGQVVLDGRDLTGVAPHLRGVGLAFQGEALFPHLDVGANVAFGLRMKGWSRGDIDERVAATLTLVGLPEVAGRSVDTLSGGQQQRVALARAIAPRPRLLMLDEPLASIDRALRDRLLEELPAVFAEVDAAVVYVTHDQAEALALADRVAVMRAGRLVQVGAPPQVWRHPATGFVARFLGLRTLDVEVSGGLAHTPFGDLPAADRADGTATLVVPPAALQVGRRLGDDAVTVQATVTARRFAGDHVVVVADTDAGMTLEVAWPDAEWPAPGDRIDVTVDTRRVVVTDPA